jgi:thiol:disulfide interchange protein DsbD
MTYRTISTRLCLSLITLLLWTAVLSPAFAQPTGTNRLSDLFTPAKKEFLPPDQAFIVSARATDASTLTVTWQIADGYYLYKKRMGFSTETTGVQLGDAELPAGEIKHDEYFGDMEVYHRLVTAVIPVTAAISTTQLNLTVKYQGCAEVGLCYNPLSKEIVISLPTNASGNTTTDGRASTNTTATATASDQMRLAELIRSGHFAVVLASFFGIGLLLAFTPCVLPMIPILSGIIIGQGESITPARGFSLAFTYVQGMAITYAAAAVAFVLMFNQAPQAFFQKPWMIGAFAGLFVVLALGMFGALTVQLPTHMQTRLAAWNHRLQSGTFIGTFAMGILSALIVTACVAPALIAALTVISQTRLIFRGATALYAMGLGMGTPLLLMGASAGHLLPKTGAWMQTIKSIFGIAFLGVAIYLLSSLIPDSASMCLWAALCIGSGYWLFKSQTQTQLKSRRIFKFIGLMSFIYGALLLMGAALGYTDPLKPLQSIKNLSKTSTTSDTNHQAPLYFQRIHSVAELDAALFQANNQNKHVMLDFYADWCVSCKEMEKYTFSQSQVQKELQNVVLLQADVTANNEDNQALLKRFGIFGPPTIAFFVNGLEREEYRVVGYVKAEPFAIHIANAFSQK